MKIMSDFAEKNITIEYIRIVSDRPSFFYKHLFNDIVIE
jgi:hypothetical protein